ncbi:hypothetical protein RND81_06G120700, partial [Saponaria officinalis]
FLYAKPSGRQRENAFTIEGFRSWNKVNGKDCVFLKHIARDHNSAHKDAVKKCNDLLRMEQHIDTLIDNITPEIIERNRLKLKVSIVAVRWLTFQHCAFRRHDESVGSLNRGNFLEFIQTIASFSKDVEKVVLENAPGNASYTSHQIQQEILSIYSGRIRDVIRNEIGDQKYCIIVDETKDVSKREQMTVILRFVDKNGYIKERLFYLIHVKETNAKYLKAGPRACLKGAIEECLLAHKLNIENIRGQGYDGASNMRGEWSSLQALFLNECPYAYYVHCFAHRLQLALIAASRDVISVYQFFSKLTFIVNIITSSAKRHNQLQAVHLAEIEKLLELKEIETGKGKNQIGTVKRAGDTRWGSHFRSLNSLLNMYNASCSVLQTEVKGAQRGEADKAYDDMTSFEFVLVFHIMIQILGITNDLCQALQRKSQDILNVMHLVSNTKILIQKLRDDGWENLLQQVLLFCNNHDIEVPNMEDHYIYGRGRFRQPKDRVTNLHYFRYDVFIAAIDSQLHELDYRFNDEMIKLLSLSSSLDPKRKFQNFKADDIYKLVSKFYPADFTEQEKLNLKSQLDLFLLEIKDHPQLDSLNSISDLVRWLAETEKGEIYYLIDRLVRLV